jgi:aminoglycoside phosphotransferase (APT) family kinase protein
MELRSPFASGRDADVYALDDARVLRRYRSGGDVSAEAEVMAHVSAHGYPVVRVLAAAGSDLVLERLVGPTMLEALASAHPDVGDAARTLADLHAQLHAIPALTAAGGQRVVHLDLHPGNVVLTSGGPVVIDWRNARDGIPDLDAAVSALILAEAAVDAAHPMREVARALLVHFLGCVREDPGRELDAAVAQRRADPGLLAAEVARLDAAALLVRSSAPGTRSGSNS